MQRNSMSNASSSSPLLQLTICALTRLVPGLRLFEIKCAWFNENCYNEFFPRPLLVPSAASANDIAPCRLLPSPHLKLSLISESSLSNPYSTPFLRARQLRGSGHRRKHSGAKARQ